MNWNDIRFFLAVARAGSLSGAATALGTSVSRVSRRVAALEADLGVALFRRSLDGYRPTDEGRALVPRAEALEGAAAALEGVAPSAGGHVRLATSENLALHVVAPALRGFAGDHPGITLEILTGPRTIDLPRSEADLALRFTRPASGNVKVRRLARMACCPYRPAGGEGAVPESFFVGWPGAFSDLPAARALERLGARPTLAASSLAVQRALAVHARARVLLPCFLGDVEPGLERAGEPIEAAAQDLWLLTDADLVDSVRVRAVSERLVRAVTARADLIEGRGEG